MADRGAPRRTLLQKNNGASSQNNMACDDAPPAWWSARGLSCEGAKARNMCSHPRFSSLHLCDSTCGTCPGPPAAAESYDASMYDTLKDLKDSATDDEARHFFGVAANSYQEAFSTPMECPQGMTRVDIVTAASCLDTTCPALYETHPVAESVFLREGKIICVCDGLVDQPGSHISCTLPQQHGDPAEQGRLWAGFTTFPLLLPPTTWAASEAAWDSMTAQLSARTLELRKQFQLSRTTAAATYAPAPAPGWPPTGAPTDFDNQIWSILQGQLMQGITPEEILAQMEAVENGERMHCDLPPFGLMPGALSNLRADLQEMGAMKDYSLEWKVAFSTLPTAQTITRDGVVFSIDGTCELVITCRTIGQGNSGYIPAEWEGISHSVMMQASNIEELGENEEDELEDKTNRRAGRRGPVPYKVRGRIPLPTPSFGGPDGGQQNLPVDFRVEVDAIVRNFFADGQSVLHNRPNGRL